MSKEFEKLVLKKLEKLDVLDERTLKLEEKYIDTDRTLKSISTELQNLNNKFTVFDYEINRKLIVYLMLLLLIQKKIRFTKKRLSQLMKRF